jgi:hypothetical protein
MPKPDPSTAKNAANPDDKLFGFYRRAIAPVNTHAISAQIWQGDKQLAIVPPIHCVGLIPSQVHQYVRKLLGLLQNNYGIRKFAALERLDPRCCPIRPCIHQVFSD